MSVIDDMTGLFGAELDALAPNVLSRWQTLKKKEGSEQAGDNDEHRVSSTISMFSPTRIFSMLVKRMGLGQSQPE